MKTVPIPNTDLTPAALCLGTSSFGATTSQADAFQLLDAYVAHGGNFLDTAEVYANWIPELPRSIGERILGAWMTQRGNRNRMLIGTKGAHPDLATMHLSRLAPADILHDLHGSLKHLQTDVIDLYWLHRDDPSRPVGEIIETLDAQVRAGKIRAFGCSNWSTARMQAAWAYANEHGLHGFVANQPKWSLAQPNAAAFGMPGLVAMDATMFAFHQQCGWAVIPYTSQAGGFFPKFVAGGEVGLKEGARKAYLNETNRHRARRAAALAQRHGVTVAQIALAYLVNQPIPTIPVIGSHTLAQLEDSLGAAAVSLNQAELRELEGG